MRKNIYSAGMDVLGAETNRALLIRVKNTAELARSQGALASFAQQIAPSTIEAKVYDTMAQQLKESLADKHVDADVTVVEPRAWKPADGKHVASDVALTVAAAGGVVVVLALLWRLVGGKK